MRMKSFKRASQLIVKYIRHYSNQDVSNPLRNLKPKSIKNTVQNFVDLKTIRAVGGRGGDGCISFLQLWANETAGPDGGDGGNGGHVILQTVKDIRDLKHISTTLRADDGERGSNKDCNGKSADHLIVKVPIGTIVRNGNGKIVADMNTNGILFVAARGGAGGKGNHFFASDTEQTPLICEYGAKGEDKQYLIEIKSIAHVGLIGFPNVGKSTLLSAVSRAKPKIAPYPFTTLNPHLGIIQFDDYEQIVVADLPGLIPESHKNKGLGIQFLKHAERCAALLFVLDMSQVNPWQQLEVLTYELSQFSKSLIERPQIIVANKMDLLESKNNLEKLSKKTNLPIVPVSAKMGTNLLTLLKKIRILYDFTKT